MDVSEVEEMQVNWREMRLLKETEQGFLHIEKQGRGGRLYMYEKHEVEDEQSDSLEGLLFQNTFIVWSMLVIRQQEVGRCL